jgi:phosphatidate cytidylyltransferase
VLRDRIITALLLAPFLLWLVLWAPNTVTVPVIAVAILIGAWEWAQFCEWRLLWQRLIYVLVIGVAMLLASYFGATATGLYFVWAVALLWWGVAFCWLIFAPLRINSLFAAIAGVLVLAPTWLAMIRLLSVRVHGVSYLLFVLVLVVAADIGAYFAGRTFGRLKLAPRVSPGKTWEGAIGGVTSAALVAIAGAHWFDLPLSRFLSLCIAVAVVSIVGDLTESMFKRNVGLKDSSSLLPGHGGILDRIDSWTAATPVFALGLMWLEVL